MSLFKGRAVRELGMTATALAKTLEIYQTGGYAMCP